MATQYLILSTKQAAMAANEDYWNKVLGRLKLPQDITQYLCAVTTDPITDNSMLAVDDRSYGIVYQRLTLQQQQFLDLNLVGENDPRVIAIKASQPRLA